MSETKRYVYWEAHILLKTCDILTSDIMTFSAAKLGLKKRQQQTLTVKQYFTTLSFMLHITKYFTCRACLYFWIYHNNHNAFAYFSISV